MVPIYILERVEHENYYFGRITLVWECYASQTRGFIRVCKGTQIYIYYFKLMCRQLLCSESKTVLSDKLFIVITNLQSDFIVELVTRRMEPLALCLVRHY